MKNIIKKIKIDIDFDDIKDEIKTGLYNAVLEHLQYSDEVAIGLSTTDEHLNRTYLQITLDDFGTDKVILLRTKFTDLLESEINIKEVEDLKIVIRDLKEALRMAEKRMAEL